MASTNSSATIFHNNLRSLNKNMDSILETFQNCQTSPDIVAFSETRLNGSSDIPGMKGYHPFEGVHSPTAAGGVGAYISNKINFSIRNDLALNLTGCEDIFEGLTLGKMKVLL